MMINAVSPFFPIVAEVERERETKRGIETEGEDKQGKHEMIIHAGMAEIGENERNSRVSEW